jgi:putative ABC transport system permease protein
MTIFDRDNWFEIWAVLRANKLRTGLTAFGVMWGIFMLIVMLAFGSAMQSGTKRNMGGIATNMMFCWGQTTTLAYEGLKPGRQIRFKTEDIEALRHLPGVEFVAPRVQLGGWQGGNVVSYESQTGSYNIFGDLPAFSRIVSFKYLAGRFINQADIDGNRKVAVVGQAVMDELFNGEDPMGKYIKISGVYFQVVGVTRTLRSGQQGDRDAHTAFIPFTTLKSAFHIGDRVGFFAMTAKPGTDGPELEREVREVLTKHHRISPDDKLAIGSFNMFVLFNKINTFFIVLIVVSWVVGGATLLAGVIGVSNIMLITVKERTKEIGVRKALGATPASIVAMVMKESVVLTLIAGLFGVAAGTGLLAAASSQLENVQDSPMGPPIIALQTVLIAVGVLVAAGGLAGIMPAAHAASIKPIEALRTE